MSILKRSWLLLFLVAIHTSPILPLAHDVLQGSDDGDDAEELRFARSKGTRADDDDDGSEYHDEDGNIVTSANNIDIGIGNIESAATNDSKGAFINRGKPTTTFLRKPSTTNKTRKILNKAFGKALGGGITGAIAGIVQVLSLMWLRTVTNYQYRYGSSFIQALTALYGMGGIPRLYSGISFALIQAPLSRFVSTAANDGASALLESFHWGPGREVLVAAVVVGFFRMMLMPIDTCKTVLQIESKKGLTELMCRVRKGDIHLLYSGSLANAASSFIGHYPWFYTYNLLSRNLAFIQLVPWATGRNALIGFISSIISDTVANFMRVIKTSKQALGSTRSNITYAETISMILAVDGWRGLFGRGLKTRILGNALQSILFTVIWRSLSERWTQVEVETDRNESSPENARDGDDVDDDDLERIRHGAMTGTEQ